MYHQHPYHFIQLSLIKLCQSFTHRKLKGVIKRFRGEFTCKKQFDTITLNVPSLLRYYYPEVQQASIVASVKDIKVTQIFQQTMQCKLYQVLLQSCIIRQSAFEYKQALKLVQICGIIQLPVEY